MNSESVNLLGEIDHGITIPRLLIGEQGVLIVVIAKVELVHIIKLTSQIVQHISSVWLVWWDCGRCQFLERVGDRFSAAYNT